MDNLCSCSQTAIFFEGRYHFQCKCPCVKIAAWPCQTSAHLHSSQYMFTCIRYTWRSRFLIRILLCTKLTQSYMPAVGQSTTMGRLYSISIACCAKMEQWFYGGLFSVFIGLIEHAIGAYQIPWQK